MAKSKPIGVRFDEELLAKYHDLTPQKILNKLTDIDLGRVNRVKPVRPIVFKSGTLTVDVKESDLIIALKTHPVNSNAKENIEKMKPILDQIDVIRNEAVPKDRDTVLGRKSWKVEQKKRIEELQKQLI